VTLNESRLRLQGEGEMGLAGGGPGDLYVVVQIQEHPQFKREGMDLVYDLKLTVAQAVHAYTLGAAYAAGREAELGSVSVGKRADLTVLDRDIFTIDPNDIRNATAVATIVGGTIEHSTLA
jgi:predicted amidohydrolase YtcJ